MFDRTRTCTLWHLVRIHSAEIQRKDTYSVSRCSSLSNDLLHFELAMDGDSSLAFGSTSMHTNSWKTRPSRVLRRVSRDLEVLYSVNAVFSRCVAQ